MADKGGDNAPSVRPPVRKPGPTPSAAELAEVERDYQQALATHRQGDWETAERLYQAVLTRQPIHAGAWHFLGLLDLAQGRAVLARERMERALALCGDKAVYWNNYGAALLELGQWRRAETALHRAIQLRRDYPDAWANLAHAQQSLRLPPALVEQAFGQALAIDPNHVGALVQLGDFQTARGRPDSAVEAFQRALARSPEHRAANLKLARVLASAGRLEEAVALVERILARRPDDPELNLMLGSFHLRLERAGDARRAFSRAAALRNDRPLWKWKCLGVCPTVFEDQQAIERYWTDLEEGLEAAIDEPMALDWRRLPDDGYTPSFNLPHQGRCCRQVRELFAARFEQSFPLDPPKGRNGERLRVGFLITAGHELGFIRGMAQIVARLDLEKFEPIVFCSRRAVERFRRAWPTSDLPVAPLVGGFEEAVQAVRGTHCDVMYFWKAGPDPWSYFLPMARLAPVQCASSGSHGTSGLRSIDYYLSSPWMESTDPAVDPTGHYTERLVGMATFPMFQSRQPKPEKASRAEFGLSEGGALYVCPHRLPKYHPAFDQYLREILLRDQTGRVVLLTGNDERGRNRLRERMARNLGAKLMERVRLQEAMPPPRYYQLLSLATLVLDAPCYASSLTAYDAFSVGVPVLTQPGPLAVQCYAAGLYRTMGIEELTARDREDYVTRAVSIGMDQDRRAQLVERIRERDHLVFDDSRVIAEYEQFFLAATGRLSRPPRCVRS